MEELNIRYSNMSDGEDLLEWLKDSKNSKWYPTKTEEEIKRFANNWIGFSKYKASLTCILENKICAIGTLFLMPYRKIAHHCSFYMIVKNEYKREEIGISLLKNLLNLAKNYFRLESITIEVFEGFFLIPILEELKFQFFAKQEKYVKEDGIYLPRLLYQHFF